jgi:anti-sigma factor RsiW
MRRRGDLTCQELVELVTDYLDGKLARRDRKRFESHIRGCENCSTYVEQIRMTIELAGRVTEDSIDPRARDALLDAFRGWKQSRPA